MLIFVSGPDRLRALRFLEEEIAGILANNPGAILVEIRPADLEDNNFVELLKALTSSRSLFGERKIVKIFECIPSLSKKDKGNFKELLKTLLLSDDYFFVFEEDEKTLAFFEPQHLNIKFYPFPFLPSRELALWLQKEAERLGGQIDKRAAELLAKWRGPETSSLAQELARLVAASGGRPVRDADVRLSWQAEESGEKTVFDLLNAVESGETSACLRHFGEAFRAPGDLSYLLTMLSYQLRSLIAGKRRNFGSRSWQKDRIAKADLSTKRLQQLLLLLHEVDVRWKSGREDPVVSLERYFMRFTRPPLSKTDRVASSARPGLAS